MFLYGRKILYEAIESGRRIKRVFLKRNMKGMDEMISMLDERNIRYNLVSDDVLLRLSGERKNQGVVFEIEDFEYSDLNDILELREKRDISIFLLDQIQDPHNLGAIIRSAVAFGLDFIVITKDRSAKITPAVVKVSAGTVFKIPVVMVVNLARALEKLKKNDITIFGTDTKGKSITELDLTGSIGVVFGNEGSGMRRLVREKCDEIITIPTSENVESLNVSVSAGIIGYEIYRQRNW